MFKKGSFSFKGIVFLCLIIFVAAIIGVDMLRVKHLLAAELGLPAPTQIVRVSSEYTTAYLRGLKINPQDPLDIDFVFDTVGKNGISEKESQKQINYFLAALSTPEENMWVNLSPYEQNRIMDDSLAQTDMGKDMMRIDYMLKQLSSSLTDPSTELGKKYWQLSNGGFNKIWITPEVAEIYEESNTVVVNKAVLDVKTEADYFAIQKNKMLAKNVAKSSVEDLLLPDIKKDVNAGKNFNELRQIYNAVILATWFKAKFRKTFYAGYMNKKKILGIDNVELQTREKVFILYKEAFEKGVYNVVRKDQSGSPQKRQFFSGGVKTACSGILTKAPRLTENFSGTIKKIRVASLSSSISSSEALKKVYVIGNGNIDLRGSATIIGNNSQIKFLGDNQEQLTIEIGEGLVLDDGFISLRLSQGAAKVEGELDTLVVDKMVIGKNVQILDGAEIMNVPTIGDDVVIVGAPVVEMDDGGVGDRSRILGNSDLKMSSIGADVVIDQQSKIYKTIVKSGAKIRNASLIGGQDELVPGWRGKDENGAGRGVVVGVNAEFKNGLAQHTGSDTEGINSIDIADGVVLDGVSLVSQNNKGIRVQVGLELSTDQQVTIYDGVVFTQEIKDKVLLELKSSNLVEVLNQDGRVVIKGKQQRVVRPELKDVLALKKRFSKEWTKTIPQVFRIETVRMAKELNALLEVDPVFITREGKILTDKTQEDDIVVSIGKGAFVYPGVRIFAQDGKTVNLNLWEIGSRGGAVIVADKDNVQLGPKDRLAGRIAAAVVRDVNLDAEFNDFGGIADGLVGNAKVSIRNQGILKDARLFSDGKGKGEIIWGWYQGQGVDCFIEGDVNIGLSHGGELIGERIEGQESTVRLDSGFNSGYRSSTISTVEAKASSSGVIQGGIDFNAVSSAIITALEPVVTPEFNIKTFGYVPGIQVMVTGTETFKSVNVLFN